MKFSVGDRVYVVPAEAAPPDHDIADETRYSPPWGERGEIVKIAHDTVRVRLDLNQGTVDVGPDEVVAAFSRGEYVLIQPEAGAMLAPGGAVLAPGYAGKVGFVNGPYRDGGVWVGSVQVTVPQLGMVVVGARSLRRDPAPGEGEFRCADCLEVVSHENESEAAGICTHCMITCDNCGAEVRGIRAHRAAHLALCGNCSETCGGCGSVFASEDLETLRDGRLRRCIGCRSYCEDCEEYNDSWTACDCTAGERVRGYGRTYPTLWLGGPTRDDGGYYIGFELEITADADDLVTPILDWAGQHLGDRNAVECKEDSSVDGFEIATQPMTPEFFERVDWESFFAMLNYYYPAYDGEESNEHGLHVHIGRQAFAVYDKKTGSWPRDDLSVAAYAYLINQGGHLERVARRDPTGYCAKVRKPVSTAVMASPRKRDKAQGQRISRYAGVGVGRDAINLSNSDTIEIRAFRSTREARDLRNAVRLTYITAEYIRHLRSRGTMGSAKALRWTAFAKWVLNIRPDAFDSIAGLETPEEGEVKGVPTYPATPFSRERARVADEVSF